MYWRSCLKEATTFEDHSGKGYYEDIIFTHSLFLKKYDLMVNNDAYFVHPEILSVNYDDIFKIHQKIN